MLSGQFPDDIRAYIQYGDSVTVLAGLLSTYGAVSMNRIHVLLGSLMGVKLSVGTIAAMVRKCAKKVGPVMKTVQKLLQKAYVGCFQDYLDVMSYLSTGKKHGISVFDALTAAFAENAEIILQ